MWTARQTDSVVSPASLLPDALSDEEQDFQTAEDNPRKRGKWVMALSTLDPSRR